MGSAQAHEKEKGVQYGAGAGARWRSRGGVWAASADRAG
jgi:hypothetical protein